MQEKTFKDVVTKLRKEKGLTQLELAKKLNITDKAVSKWERGLSYPDITSISALAKALDTDTSYLIDLCEKENKTNPYSKKEDINKLVILIFNAIALAMGVAVVVLIILNQIDTKNAILLLGIGLFSISISLLIKNNKDN
jgi:transcriptional regulator with XRE-family HTH domain